MSISSVGGASSLSQLYSTQQAQALSAVSPDDPLAGSTSDASTAQAGNSNALTGTTTSNLDSQTLQALLDLTQQDPTSDPSQADQTGQSQSGQAQHAHRHHHHHGGMTQASSQTQSTDASGASTTTATADSGAADASLEQALTTM